MKALVLEKDKLLSYQDVPDPKRPGPDWVLVQVAFSGICNSDLHRGFGGRAYHYPLIMGHEFSGRVCEAFSGSRFVPGDRVVVFPLIPCRRCTPCQTGDFAQCVQYDYIGSRRDGAFADFVWAPEKSLFRVPDGVDLKDASMTEPCAVALHGAGKAPVRPGDSAAVFGGGPIGNMAAQWLRIRGADKVFVVDVDTQKLRIAADMGFIPIDPGVGNPVGQIQAATDGAGADHVMEAVGLPGTFLQAVQSVARSGHAVFLGNIRGDFVIGEKDFSSILRREVTIHGTWNSRIVPEEHNEWSVVLSAMGKGLRVAPLISHVVELADGTAIFDRIRSRSEFFNKVIFKP